MTTSTKGTSGFGVAIGSIAAVVMTLAWITWVLVVIAFSGGLILLWLVPSGIAAMVLAFVMHARANK